MVVSNVSGDPNFSFAFVINAYVALDHAGSPSVANSGVSGSGNSSITLARAYLPLGCGNGHSFACVTWELAAGLPGTSGNAVIGRACTIKNCQSFMAHSMSIGWP